MNKKYCRTGIFRNFLPMLIKLNSAERLMQRFSVPAPKFPKLVCLQNSTIITSTKTCHAVTTGYECMPLVITSAVGGTSGLKVFRKMVIFGVFSISPKNTSFTIPSSQFSTQQPNFFGNMFFRTNGIFFPSLFSKF